MNRPMPKVVVVNTSKRDWIIGIVAGLVVVGFLAIGIWTMYREVAGYRLTGTIVSKNFTPQPEEQVSIGKGGLHERKVDGIYTFEVRVESENNRIYTIWVDKTDYDARKTGEVFSFMRPPPARPATGR